jgi:hypothetical protein
MKIGNLNRVFPEASVDAVRRRLSMSWNAVDGVMR